jgi:ABC-type polysaccharide/polyol phosphate transport system ATPase subunit
VSIIEFQGVSKSYPIFRRPSDRLKELLTLNRSKFHEDFWALEDVSFQVSRGETFCIVGENGSGKSTLLQIVAGILAPSRGIVRVKGRVSALLELGSGFNPEFTGRDNIYLNGAILGFSTAQIDRIYQRIEQFAEIGPFIHQPVKTYSSGMIVRLAFSVAIHVDPEILIVDEALAVGDIYFRQRCLRKVHELRSSGVTILFVSHSTGDVKAIGDRAMWLDHGRIREIGATNLVVAKYLAAMAEKDTAYLDLRREQAASRPSGPVRAPEVVEEIPNIDHRFGDGRAEILGITVMDEFGHKLGFLEPGGDIVVRISVRAIEELERPNVGFLLRNHLGVDFSGANTTREGVNLPPMRPGDVYTVDFHLKLPELYAGSFSFSPAIADGTLTSFRTCDWIDNAITLQMAPAAGPIYGYQRIPCRIQVNARMLERRAPEVEIA